MLKLKLNFNDLTDAHSIPATYADFLKEHKQEIYEYIAKQHDVNPFTYEGGVDTWFGLGSVMLYELCLEPSIEWKADEVTLTIR